MSSRPRRDIVLTIGLLTIGLFYPVGSSRSEEISIAVDAATGDGTLSTWFEPSMFATHCPPDMLQEFLNDAGGETAGMVRLGVGNVLGSSTSLNNYIQRLDASDLNGRVQAVSDAGGQVLIGITKTPLWISSYTGSPMEKVCSDWYKFQTFAPAADKWDDWQMAVYETVKHFSIDMGFDHVTYEFWNEPNHICFWGDTQANFLEMWKYTVWGAEQADPNVHLGGCSPASPGARLEGETVAILRAFIEYSANQDLDLDFATYHYFGPPPVAFLWSQAAVTAWLEDNGFNGIPIIISEHSPRDSILTDESWPSPPSALGRRVDSEMGAAYELSAIKYMATGGYAGYQTFAHLCNFKYDEEYPEESWGARTHYVMNRIRKAIYHPLTMTGRMARSLVASSISESNSQNEYFPHFHAIAGAEDRQLTLLFWNYVAVPFYQAAYSIFDIGYTGDDWALWGGSVEMRRFYAGEIPVSDLTSDPQEQQDLLWSKRVYERQQILVTESHEMTIEIENFWPEYGHRVTRHLIDETHSNSYYHYVASGLQAAINNQYLDTLDQRHLDRIEELGSMAVKPYSVGLLTITADLVAKVEGLAWGNDDPNQLHWDETAGATSYDMVRGELLELRAEGGFTGAVPLSCEQPGNNASDPDEPPVGNGFYYLVRGRAGYEVRSWGSATRNTEISACE